MMYKYPELRNVLFRIRPYFENLVATQHMGTVDEDRVPIPSLVLLEMKDIIEMREMNNGIS